MRFDRQEAVPRGEAEAAGVRQDLDREAVAVHQRLGRAEEEEPQDPDREACQAPRVKLQARLAPRVEQ